MKYAKILLMCVIFILLISVNLYAIIPLESNSDKEITQLIQSQNYNKAINTINNSINSLEPKDYYIYTLGNLQYIKKDFDASISTLNKLINDYPESDFYHKAIMLKTWSYAGKGNLLDAYRLYKDRLDYILSDERRNDLSGRYIELARELTAETEEDKPTSSELRKASEYYSKAIEIGVGEELEDDIDFEFALTNYKRNNSSLSYIGYFDKVIDNYTDSEYIDDALYYSGKIYYNYGRYSDASERFTELYRTYPESEYAPEAIYNSTKDYNFPYPDTIRSLELSANLISRIMDDYPDSEYAKTGHYELAKAYNRFEEYHSKSIELLRSFVETYPDDTDLAPDCLITIGRIHRQRKDYDSAIEVFQEFLQEYPSYKEWQNIQSEIISVNYQKASEAYNNKDYDLAVKLYKDFMFEYPIDSRNSGIMYTIGDIYYNQELWDKAIQQWKSTASKYPNTYQSAKSMLDAGITLEEKLGKLKEAKEAYEKVEGDYYIKQEAKERIEMLTRKELKLKTEKIFVSGEKPYVNLGLRNIETVTIKIYNLDLKEYFISEKNISNIHNLDIILIEPDYEFESGFGNGIDETFEELKYFDTKIDLPIEDTGSYVIYIESAEYKTSVLYMISDIGMVVKSTKDEALIHLKDIKNEKSASDVELMIASGSRIIDTAVSDKDGIIKLDLNEYREAGYSTNTLKYFAYKDKHYASSELYTGGLYTPSKSEKAGYIFTDKDKYKPGDTVNYKAVLREINQGVIENIKDNDFTISLTTYQEGEIFKTTKELTGYGTLYGSIELPQTISGSSYNYATLTIRSKNYSFYKSNIPITMFKPAEKELKIEFDKSAYRLGENMNVSVAGYYLSGAPTTNTGIEYFIPGNDKWEKAELNDEGRFEIVLDTSIYPDMNMINIQARFDDSSRDMVYSGSAFIILKDFSINLTTAKDLYLPDENAEIIVETKDYIDNPTSKLITLRLYRTQEGSQTQELVSEETINTNDAGEYSFSYGDSVGGSYSLTAEGIGENGIPVTKTIEFRIISEEGGNLIEILPEGLDFKVGESKQVKVYSKVEGGLALFTAERAKILEYRLVNLEKGVNNINITVTETYAPNSAISVSLAKQDGFYYSTRELQVESGIEIGLETDAKTYAPASDVQLSINTKDIYGNTIPSELMLVVVDDAVLKATNTNYKDIKDIFYKELTLSYITQTASTPFVYTGLQEDIDADLLTERDRRELNELEGTISTTGADDLYTGNNQASGGGMSGESPGYYDEEVYDMAEESPMEAEMDYDDDGFGRELKKSEEKQRSDKDTSISNIPEDVVRKILKDTAYFKPNIITNEDGTADINFTLPDNLTRWRIFVLANNDGSLFGMNNTSVVSTRDLVVNIDAPIELIEGDEFNFNLSLQNNITETITGDLDIAMISDGRRIDSQSEPISIRGKSSKLINSKRYTATDKDFKLKASTEIDGEQRDIRTRKWATVNRTGIEGFTERTVFRYIELDDDIMNNAVDKKLVVKVLPNSFEILKDIKDNPVSYVFGAEAIAQSLIININLYKYYLRNEPQNTPAIEEIKNEINSNISMLEMWGKNGYWTFEDSPNTGSVDYNVTALAYYSLATAEKEEFDVNDGLMRKASENLLAYHRKLDNRDIETKALLSMALSVNKKIDVLKVNELYSEARNSLSLRGLGMLSIALDNLNLSADAQVVNAILIEGIMEKDMHILEDTIPVPDYFTDWYLVQALGLYAVLGTEELTKEMEERINSLATMINDTYRSPNFLTFMSMLYFRYLVRKDEVQPDFKLSINANDEQLYSGRIKSNTKTLEVSTDKVLEENEIEFNIEGSKGMVIYEAYVEYSYDNSVPENLNNTDELLIKRYEYPQYLIDLGDADINIEEGVIENGGFGNEKVFNKNQKAFNVVNTYNQSLSQMDTQINSFMNFNQYQGDRFVPIKKNYDILAKKQSDAVEKYKNEYGNYDVLQEIKKVAKGTEIPVVLNVSFADEDEKNLYYIVEDTIPAGFVLVDGSVSGVNAYKQSGNTLIFYLKKANNYSKTIRYSIKGEYKGKYRAFPPKYYQSRFRGREVVEEADTLEVLDEDYDIFSDYKLSPYELYPIGTLYFEIGRYDEAEKYLDELFENWNLKPYYRKVTAYSLMRIAIEKGNKPGKVAFFYEILRDEFPSTEIKLTDLKKISEAYEELGEGDKAYYLVESLFRSYFGQEFDLSVTLLMENYYNESYDTAMDIIMEYPDIPVVRNAVYSYGQLNYAMMNRLDRGNTDTTEDGTPLANHLYQKTYDMFTAYLTLYPDIYNVDEVSFSLMNLFFDTKRYEAALQSGRLFVSRYPESEYLDDYLYLSGLALFTDNRVDEAMNYLEKVAYNEFKDSEGILRKSPNRLYALRLIAQSLHSKGNVDEAVEIYEEIKNQFKDAKRSLEILQEKFVEIDDVHTIPIESETTMEIRHKNIDKVTAKIYKVDFVILALTEKNLSDVTQVNLSGINPILEEEYELEYEKNYLPATSTIELPIHDMGAYLVVIRSEIGEKSAIIVKSDLDMDVYEASDGRVRVNLTDEDNNFVNDMKMYFIGTNNSSFKFTETDIRGMAEVEGINGNVMIIGEKDGEYVFYRSEKYISGYSYGYESINNLKEINNQRDQLQKYNISMLENILRDMPKSITIMEIYSSKE